MKKPEPRPGKIYYEGLMNPIADKILFGILGVSIVGALLMLGASL